MINFEIIENTSKKNGQKYTILRLNFLLKDGSIYEMDVFASKEQQAILKFVADPEQIAEYLNSQAF